MSQNEEVTGQTSSQELRPEEVQKQPKYQPPRELSLQSRLRLAMLSEEEQQEVVNRVQNFPGQS